MFALRRGRMPFLIPILLAVAFGYALSGGIGSVVGALLFLPLLILKLAFMMLFFGFVFRMFAYRGGPGWHHGRHRGSRSSAADSAGSNEPPPATEAEDKDWEEALRRAKREIDKLFPNPRE